MLDLFHLASGLCINWDKSVAYWLANTPAPPWLAQTRCQWVVEQQVSKLLGIPFGIDLHTIDVDEFMLSKIHKKLIYWTTIHLSLAGRVLIVNFVLLSSLWYFIMIWAGSLAMIRKIRASLRDFLWSGSDHTYPVRVGWYDCCASRRIGSLDIVDPTDTLLALTTKWMLKALTLGNSNIQYLLRHRILQILSAGGGSWPRHVQWAMFYKFSVRQGSRAWERISQAWRKLVHHIEYIPPQYIPPQSFAPAYGGPQNTLEWILASLGAKRPAL
jgi:hypothetical protein